MTPVEFSVVLLSPSNEMSGQLSFTTFLIGSFTNHSFQVRHPVVLYRIIDVKNMQSNTTQLMILLRCISYILSFNDMFGL